MRGGITLGTVGALVVIGLCTIPACSKTGDACSSAADCGSNQSCVYAISDGCGARTTCQDNPSGPIPDNGMDYCGCDGGTVFVAASEPGGYAERPIAGPAASVCPTASKEAGAPCTDTSECGIGQLCIYPLSDACSVQGLCLEAPALQPLPAMGAACPSAPSDADAPSSQGDVGTTMQGSADATDEGSASDPLDGGPESQPTPGSLTCVRSTRYADVEACPADGGPFVYFECGGSCLEFVTLLGPGMNIECQLGGSTADGAIPVTDAGTIVACCPQASSQLSTPVRCEGPFM